MKILFAVDNFCAHYYINLALGKALTACGHNVGMWDMSKKSAMDIFSEFVPDLYIGHTYTIDNGLIQCFQDYPHCMCILKASDYGNISDNLDRNKYPVLIANQREIDLINKLRDQTGKPDFLFIHYCEHRLKDTHTHWLEQNFAVESMLSGGDVFDFTNPIFMPELESDICFVGGYWPYKAQTLNKWILPLCSSKSKYKVKIFGNQPWSVAQYCGFLPDDKVKNLFYSSKICPSVSELHSQDLGYDIIDRTFKICLAKGFCISDYVEDLVKLIPEGIVFVKNPEEFREKIDFYIDKFEKMRYIAELGYKNVIENHSYFSRASHMFLKLNRPDLANQVINTFTIVRERLGL